MSLAAEILAQMEDLPALPAVVGRVMALSRDPEFAMGDLVEAVRLDPGITATVLRLCNSPFYGLRQPVSSLERALPHLGTAKLIEITLASAVASFFQGEQPGYLLSRGQLWRHSITVALIAGQLAQDRGLAEPATLHTAGLLHDVGKLVLAAHINQEFPEIGRLVLVEGKELVEAEREVLGIDHAELGGQVADRWNLSAPVAQVIRHHHSPAQAPGDRELVNLATLADYLAHAVSEEYRLGPEPLVPPTSLIIDLRLAPADLRRLTHQMHGLLENAGDLLALAG
ncbi:MAG: HDOD domain-containing protein [Deltaproteobacteria bacterium]|nr:HDOD domain-containing protein [Deltaproteobacteria bacterium]